MKKVPFSCLLALLAGGALTASEPFPAPKGPQASESGPGAGTTIFAAVPGVSAKNNGTYLAPAASASPPRASNSTADAMSTSLAPASGMSSSPPLAPACAPVVSEWSEVRDAPGRFWFSGEYLLWCFKDAPAPALVTQGTAASLGVLGRDGTSVLIGESGLDGRYRSGARFTAGFTLNDRQTLGIEGSYFFLGRRGISDTRFGFGAPNGPVLARPFFNVVTGAEDAELVVSPNTLGGSVRVTTDSQLQGSELNLVGGLHSTCDACGNSTQINGLVGFRYLELSERLGITEDLLALPGVPVLAGNTFLVRDRFDTHNQFYGGMVGLRAELRRSRISLIFNSKLALGGTHETVTRRGATRFTSPAGTATDQDGGLLVLPTNSGTVHGNSFAVVPEVGLTLGWNITDRLRATIGYSLLYWSEVARPGDQIDRGINPSQIPTSLGPGTLLGAARPAPSLRGGDFWAQGITFGLEFGF